MSHSDRKRFRESMAIPAGLAAVALIAVPSAVSNADKRTVTVEVAFADRIEIEHEPPVDRRNAATLAPAPRTTTAAASGEARAPLTRFNVLTTPGRPLTAHVETADRARDAMPRGLLCSFGDRRAVACDAGGLTVNASAETEFRLDRTAPSEERPQPEAASGTLLEVTIAYQ